MVTFKAASANEAALDSQNNGPDYRTTRRSGLTRQRVFAAWLFLTPMFIILAGVAGWPLARTIWFRFTDTNLADMAHADFVGLANYLSHDNGQWSGLLVAPGWWRSVWNTVLFAGMSVTLETFIGMVVALVLNARFPGRALVRTAVLIPWAIPTIVSAKMWSWMLNDQFGIVNHALLALGVITHPLAWTADPNLALLSVVIVDVWKTTPFMALLILAGLQMLPTDCYEAAKVDGIHPLSVFFKVTLPLIRPAIMVAVIFRALDALRVFDLIYVLTSNSEDTMSMSVYARQQLVDFQNVGYGSAASTLLFMIIALCVILTMMFGRMRFDDEQ